MDIRRLDPRDESLVRQFWEVGRAAEADEHPYDFFPSWESTWLMLSQGRQDLDIVLLGAFEDGRLQGVSQVEHPLHDNLHTASATYQVHPSARRRGLGRALAEASYDVARERGRRTIFTEATAPLDAPSAGLGFAEAVGFREALVDGMKVVDLHETEHLWAKLDAAAAPRHPDYRVVTWGGQVPEELLADYCRLCELFVDEAPMGELEVEAERWGADRVRTREADKLRRGRHEVAAGALAPDGSLVALTEVGLDRFAPTWGFQSGTLVDPAHRGRALGTSVKAANHRHLRADFPQCRVLVTGNASVNVAMNAVNEAFGYREVERCVEMQRDIGWDNR